MADGTNLVLGYTKFAHNLNCCWLCPSFTNTTPTLKRGSFWPGSTFSRMPNSAYFSKYWLIHSLSPRG
jgi:hypothetical protein